MAETKKKEVSSKRKVTTKKTNEEVKEDGINQKSAITASQTDEQKTEVVEKKASKTTAKAGKRSAKALEEAEEKQAKEDRKAHAGEEKPEKEARKVERTAKSATAEGDGGPKKIYQPARSRLERRSKKFRKASERIDKDKEYTLKEALELATKTSTTKFDATVEMHVRLNVDPRQADQNVRDTVLLPAGTGKIIRIAVFAEADDAAAAKKAGADIATAEEITQLLDKQTLDFDVLIATPSQMAKLGKYARLLGPKGLMPNPKSGTVTTDITKAVTEAKAGRVEYRVDSTGIVHLGIGKVSFGPEKLLQNAQAVLASLRSVKPASIKGTYITSAFITTTMGPSIKLQI